MALFHVICGFCMIQSALMAQGGTVLVGALKGRNVASNKAGTGASYYIGAY